MSTLAQLKRKWLPDPAFRRAYDSLKPEFQVARQLIAARNRAGLTQAHGKRPWTAHSEQPRALCAGGRLHHPTAAAFQEVNPATEVL